MCTKTPSPARAPLLVTLRHSGRHFPPHKYGSRNCHFPSMPNSSHRADPKLQGGKEYHLTSSQWPPGFAKAHAETRYALAHGRAHRFPPSQGTFTLLPVPRGCSFSPEPHLGPRQTANGTPGDPRLAQRDLAGPLAPAYPGDETE